jgi:hypothetical protein
VQLDLDEVFISKEEIAKDVKEQVCAVSLIHVQHYGLNLCPLTVVLFVALTSFVHML